VSVWQIKWTKKQVWGVAQGLAYLKKRRHEVKIEKFVPDFFSSGCKKATK
jgi:hypothetical protein